jgi:hypothetical protein
MSLRKYICKIKETLKRRENSRTRKIVRLSEVLSELDINELQATPRDDENVKLPVHAESRPLDNMSSLTNVTDFSEADPITIYNGNTSLMITLQHYVNNNTEPFTNIEEESERVPRCESNSSKHDLAQDSSTSCAEASHLHESNASLMSCNHLRIPDTNPDYPQVNALCHLNREQTIDEDQSAFEHTANYICKMEQLSISRLQETREFPNESSAVEGRDTTVARIESDQTDENERDNQERTQLIADKNHADDPEFEELESEFSHQIISSHSTQHIQQNNSKVF